MAEVKIDSFYGAFKVVKQLSDRQYECECICGAKAIKGKRALLSSKYAVCLHNKLENRLFKLWTGLVARSRREKSLYPVCVGWLDYYSFKKDVGLPPSLSSTFYRPDATSQFSPDNFAWGSRKEACNAKRISKSNKSGHKGVAISNDPRRKSLWKAVIYDEGFMRVQYCKTKEEAIAKRKEWEVLKSKGILIDNLVAGYGDDE